MIIKKLVLVNFGKHDRIEFNCEGPVVGLLGPNGAGKSTILDGLELALTGEGRDTLDSYVRYGKSNATVEAVFQKNGKEGTIFRQFGKTSKRKLTWDGQTITAAREVDQRMSEIFGADKKAVANAVFINQGELQGILFKKEADRKTLFIRLVNMSFCEQRRSVIDARIKQLAGSLSDLTQVVEVCTRQLGEAQTAHQAIESNYQSMPDYTAEMDFCDGRFRAIERQNQILAELGQLENEHQVHRQRMDFLLTSWNLPDYQMAVADMEKREKEFMLVTADRQYFQSVCVELTHYGNVLADIQRFGDQLKREMENQQTINPKGLSVEEVEALEQRYTASVQAHAQIEHNNGVISRYLNDLSVEQVKLSKLVSPGFDEDYINQQTTRLLGVRSLTASLMKFRDIRKGIRDNLETDKLKCHECGLTLADPGELSPEGFEALKNEIDKLEKEAAGLEEKITRQREQLRVYEIARDACTAQISYLNSQIDEWKTRTDAIKPEFLLAESQAEQQQMVMLKTRLPGIAQVCKQLGQLIQEKMQEKSRYPLAIKHWDERDNFSQEKATAWDTKYNTAETEIRNYRKQFEEINRLAGLMQSLQGQQQRLIGEKQELIAHMEKPMPPVVASLSMDLNGDLGAIKMELSNRQQARTSLYGRCLQAKEAYDRVLSEYNTLMERVKADEEKRNLVQDLKLLDDLMKPDGLPMAVVRHHFKHLAQLTQDALNKLNANFSIEIDPEEELSFRFTRLDESGAEPLPMSKLSGGQRVRLCTAFLMAVQHRLVKEVGLLVLDEPSTHVDSAGVETLASFITELGQQLQNTEMQVWLADHHAELHQSMTKVLELV